MPDAIGKSNSSVSGLTRRVVVKLPNGADLAIPLSGSASGDVAGSTGTRTLDALRDTLEGVFELLGPLTEKALPGKTTVEMGFEVSYEAGKILAWLADAGAKASVKVTFEWDRKA